MRAVDTWLNDYGESHQNSTNKLIHWICVPAIVWSVVALIWSIPAPVDWLNWAVLTAIAAQLYYIKLSPRLSVGIGLFVLACLALCLMVERAAGIPLWQIALAVFVVAWIGQFIGHKIEGQKPSFFKDVLFLMIGPAWLMAFVYRRMGWQY